MARILRLSCVTFLCFVFAGCNKTEPPPAPEVARPAKLFQVQEAGAQYIRRFPGEVRASDRAELAFRVSGELIELPVNRGQPVETGELLAKLDPVDYQAVVSQARAEYELAKAQFDRAAELVDRQLVAKSEYDFRLAQYRVKESELLTAENDLRYTELHAPFRGTVASVSVENHESVLAGLTVMVLQTGDMVDVIVDVPESIVSRAQRRDEQSPETRRFAKVRFGAVSDQLYDAIYKEHDAQADPATLTYKVTFTLPQPTDLSILPGMSATLIVDLSFLFPNDEQGRVVPVEAVFSAEDQPVDTELRQVWVVDPATSRANRRDVRVGGITGSDIVIHEGLDPGEVIIAAGVHSVQEGMLVSEMERERGL